MFDRPLEIPGRAALAFVASLLTFRSVLRFPSPSRLLPTHLPSGVRMRAGNYGRFPLNLSLWRVHGLSWLPLCTCHIVLATRRHLIHSHLYG